MILPIVTNYSNLQLRLGYLKFVAAIGGRSPTTMEALERKLAPLFPSPPNATQLRKSDSTDATYIEHLFDELGHHKGQLNKHNLHELITLGKSFQFLHQTNCSLLEIAVVLQAIMTPAALQHIREGSEPRAYNPLKLDVKPDDYVERAFFLLHLLNHDIPVGLMACVAAEHEQAFHLYAGFPLPTAEAVLGTNAVATVKKGAIRKPTDEVLTPYTDKNLLLDSYRAIVPRATKQISLTNWKKNWVTYFEGDEPAPALGAKKFYRMGKRSSFRHHAAPRTEFLLDLGLLDGSRGGESGHDESEYTYRRNERTQRFASYFREHFLAAKAELDIQRFTRRRGIAMVAYTYGLNLAPTGPEDVLSYLIRGYAAVKRVIGTTPMWTTALMGSLLALRDQKLVEAETLYDRARAEAQLENAKIRLAGGSRFDGEFLLNIAPELVRPIEHT